MDMSENDENEKTDFLSVQLKKSGIKQRQLAAQIGELPQTITNWINRNNIPPLKRNKVARALGIPVAVVNQSYPDDEAELELSTKTEDTDALLPSLRSLSLEDLELVKMMILRLARDSS